MYFRHLVPQTIIPRVSHSLIMYTHSPSQTTASGSGITRYLRRMVLWQKSVRIYKPCNSVVYLWNKIIPVYCASTVYIMLKYETMHIHWLIDQLSVLISVCKKKKIIKKIYHSITFEK